eukprot:TRINITY_DN3224_c0_g1_i2.p1 TRINITY_DN3224_c0_g1~~TRINITY_DN3224_c0_g1_i2.p1  ORF type:complete len:330 (-),score=90.42 TRINITY_DN3224_c0_g1_i2:623-1588(-)
MSKKNKNESIEEDESDENDSEDNMDEDEDESDDEDVPSIEEVKEKKANFVLIPKIEVREYMEKQLKKFESITGLPKEKVYLLWTVIKNPTEFENKYFENMNKYLKLGGVLQDEKEKPKVDPKKKFECKICFSDTIYGETYSVGCGHEHYCKDCWNDYLKVLVKSSSHEMLNAKCMSVGCNIRLTATDWKNLLKSPKDKERYDYFYLKAFIDVTNNLSFCPSPNCGNVLKYTGHSKTDILNCTCGSKFCVGCSNEAHNPITCKQFEKWNAKLLDEGASLKLLHTIAKCCFHCGMPTERNQGCNHMTCRKEVGGCGGEWCYVK